MPSVTVNSRVMVLAARTSLAELKKRILKTWEVNLWRPTGILTRPQSLHKAQWAHIDWLHGLANQVLQRQILLQLVCPIWVDMQSVKESIAFTLDNNTTTAWVGYSLCHVALIKWSLYFDQHFISCSSKNLCVGINKLRNVSKLSVVHHHM